MVGNRPFSPGESESPGLSTASAQSLAGQEEMTAAGLGGAGRGFGPQGSGPAGSRAGSAPQRVVGAWRRASWATRISFGVLCVLLLLAIFGPLVAPQDPQAVDLSA